MTWMFRRTPVVAAGTLALASGAGAQEWPAKPVRVVGAFTAA
jgi:hypothetical protein